MLPAEPKPSRNSVPRRDAENKDRVAARLAERLAEKLLRENPDTYHPDCPPPLFTSKCYLLKKSTAVTTFASNPTCYLVLYDDPECAKSEPEIPQGIYAYVCIYNAARDEDEIRCGSNDNGMNVHLTLSGNAALVVCAGELLFSEEGVLLAWNAHSGSYRPEEKDAVLTGFPVPSYRLSDAPLTDEPVLRSSVPSIPSTAGLAAMELKKLFRKTSEGAVGSVFNGMTTEDVSSLSDLQSKLVLN